MPDRDTTTTPGFGRRSSAPRSMLEVGSRFAALALLTLCVAGCGLFSSDEEKKKYDGLPPATIDRISLLSSQSEPLVGAAQGVAVRDDLVYVFGDADTGIIVEYTQMWSAPPQLNPTGRVIRLTRNGEDLIPHPTGLTFHPTLDTFIGNTVDEQGEIFAIDFDRALADGNLDNAVLNRTVDDEAVNGSRPEYARYHGDAVIATADYGPEGNEVRLYDPERLSQAERTSEDGVVVGRLSSGPWVQSLHWLDDRGTLVLVQNQIEGMLYRLSFVRLEKAQTLRRAPKLDLDYPRDEFEGFALLESNRCLLVSSSHARNIWFGLARFESNGDTAP